MSDERVRITLTFCDRVPPWLLKRHSIRLETDTSDDTPHDPDYVVAFFRNSDGFLRMISGEGGSNCCLGVPGRHPDRFTYTGVLPRFLYEAVPPPTWLRGFSTRRLDCEDAPKRQCALFGGRVADRTRWVEI